MSTLAKRLKVCFFIGLFAWGVSACIPSKTGMVIQEAWLWEATAVELKPGDLNASCICDIPLESSTQAFVTLQNDQPAADRLVGARTDAAARVEFRRADRDAALSGLAALQSVELPVDETVKLSPDGVYLYLTGLKADLRPGDVVAVTLVFDRWEEETVQFVVKGKAQEQP